MATILVVDDEYVLREMLNDVLVGLGHEVLSAATAAEAIKLCEVYPEPIDIMLTDLGLPMMDGVVLTQIIGLKRSNMAFIIMSASPDLSDIDWERLPDNTRLLTKPFDIISLADIVQECLQQTR